MNYLAYLQEETESKINYFYSNLSPTNRTPDYYINWDKVVMNTKEIEIGLNTLNYLIGKKNMRSEARELFMKQPELLKVIPSLIASRDKVIDVLLFDEKDNMIFERLDFFDIDLQNIEGYLDFLEKSGLFTFLKDNSKKSLVDYVFGVEAGLDSNARKNRSGTTMENIVERNISRVCKELGLDYKTQATSKWIYDNWDIHVPVDKSIRRFDIAVYNQKNNAVYVIETNYYGGGGSKLKSVCGEFSMLNELIATSEDNVQFIWITDGLGWFTAKSPMTEAFSLIDNIFNLNMLKNNYLSDVFLKN